MKRLLFTGRGGNGSWEVRGAQLGRACLGVVQPKASLAECAAADVVVVVKRVPPDLLSAVRRSGRPWVYDIVDSYPQPMCAAWDRTKSIAWVREQIRSLNPTAVVWPTLRMKEDCDDGRPGFVLPHHHRPGIRCNPVREDVRTVGYEGRALYLGQWSEVLQKECRKRGWRFVTNPEHLSDLDIVVAVRGGEWSSYAARHWKSNVKLANAHGSGTPFIGNPEWGYMETGTGCEYWVDERSHLVEAFERLAPQTAREQVADRFRSRAYQVEQAAADLRRFVDTL